MRTTRPNHQLARDRRISKTESRVLEALSRRDRATGRPRAWLDLKKDREWLIAEVGTEYIAQVVNRMAKKGSMFQMGGGRYVVASPGTIDSSQAVTFGVALDITMGERPYFLAYAAAMSDHDLIDETVDPVIAVKGSALGGGDTVRVRNRAVHVVRITSARKWFGLERVAVDRQAGYWRSDLERTLLDAIDRPDMAAGHELAARAWERAAREERVDIDKLAEYAVCLGGIPALRVAYFSRASSLDAAADAILSAVPRTRSSSARLDSTRGYGDGDWRRDHETGLLVNVPEDLLRGWMSYGE